VDVTRQWSRLNEIFLPDGVLSYPEPMGYDDHPGSYLEGVEEISRWLTVMVSRGASAGSNRGGHVMANVLVEVTGDLATQNSTVLIGYESQRSVAMYIGRYTGEWVRTESGWRIRRMDFSLAMDLPA
jgi:predicted ribosome-associated RNA-binding protein Tma20